MKRIIVICILIVGLSGCKKYFVTKTMELGKGMKEYSLESADLYLKCTCLDSLRKVPVYCSKDENDTIEVEYMFISPDNRVLVINNIPDRYQRFFDDGSKSNQEFIAARQLSHKDVNIFPISQFRFGKISDDQEKLIFKIVDKEPQVHEWNIDKDGNNITVKSIGTRENHGIDIGYTKNALYLEPVFRKVESFRLIFEKPNDKDHSSREVISKTILLEDLGNKKRLRRVKTYFLFADANGNKKEVAIFSRQRMYAIDDDL